MSILVELPEDQYSPTALANFSSHGGFDIGTARAMAWISQLAYETRLPDKIARIAKRWELRDIRDLKQPAKSTLPLSSTFDEIKRAIERRDGKSEIQRLYSRKLRGTRCLPNSSEAWDGSDALQEIGQQRFYLGSDRTSLQRDCYFR